MKKLHHKSARYELQIWRPTTLSWKPIAHEQEYEAAIVRIDKLAKNNPSEAYRLLDRKDGVNQAKVVA